MEGGLTPTGRDVDGFLMPVRNGWGQGYCGGKENSGLAKIQASQGFESMAQNFGERNGCSPASVD